MSTNPDQQQEGILKERPPLPDSLGPPRAPPSVSSLPQKSVVVQEDKTMDGEKCYTVIDSDEAARIREHEQLLEESRRIRESDTKNALRGGRKRRRKTKRKRRRKTKTKRKRRKSKRKTKKQKRRRRRRR